MIKHPFIILLLIVMVYITVSITVSIIYRAQQRKVTVQLRGGLGNRIFQILGAQGYAEKHNRKFVIVRSMNLKGKREHEDNSIAPLQALFPAIEIQDTLDEYETIDVPGSAFQYHDIPDSDKKNVVLRGYFQSEKYFPVVAVKAIEAITAITAITVRRKHYPNTYFIHIRAGDYLNNKTHFIDLSQYHTRAIKEIQRADKSAKFLVFSDDTRYAREYMKQFRIPYDISAAESADDTLLEMSACAGAICANSSLSWLGAYFQKQPRHHVYMPARWINDAQDTTDLYPSWAKKVSVDSGSDPRTRSNRTNPSA